MPHETVTPALFAITASRGRWQAAPHLLMLSDKLTQVAAGNLKRLMVFMPPRHGKSQLISQYFPAWYLGHHPDRRIILTSYEANFAASWGAKARDAFKEYAPSIFGHSLKSDTTARNDWGIEDHVGGMNTAGVGGAMTGKGADLLIIDDPVKNAQDADSQIMQYATQDWYQSTAYTRLEPNGAAILVMTRWNTKDLGGFMLKEMDAGGETWEVLKFPAIAEENDQLGRKIGDPLWAARYPLEALERIKGTVSDYWWQAMYQQRARSRTGKTFKRQNFIIVADGAAGSQVRFWDLAATEETKGKDPDWTVGCLMSERGGKYWIKNIVRVLEEPGEVEKVIKQTAQLDGKETRIFMEQEGGASGKTVIAHYALTVLKGYAFEGVSPTGSKPVRAIPFAAAVSNNNVHLIAARWNTMFLDEAEQFPTAKVHDDQVDAASQAFNLLSLEDPTITEPLPLSIGGYSRGR